jgi:two-component system response regulator FixJ
LEGEKFAWVEARADRDLLEAIAARALPLPVIAATRDGNLKTVVQVLRAGTLDVLEKPYRGSDLEQRLHELLPAARRYRDRAQASLAIAKRIGRLTPREHDVLAYLIQGLQNKVIAQKLGISHRTVELYRARIMEKMQAPSLVHLVAMSFLCGKELPSEKPERAVWARSPDELALTR